MNLSWRQLIAGMLMVVGVGMIVVSYGQVWWAQGWYWLHQQTGVHYSLEASNSAQPTDRLIQPVSTDFGLVIEKLDINERVAAEVDPTNPTIYLPILAQYGVAQAAGSVAPGEVGTTYLFGHSTINFWDIGKYHAPFTLLNQLTIGDKIVVFYLGQRFNYQVTGTQVVAPTAVHYLTDPRTVPTLILQTCDPPGENVKRLLIFAELQ